MIKIIIAVENYQKSLNVILQKILTKYYKKDIKLFIIASPTTSHDFYIRKLIKYNKIIYCEKPIIRNNKKLSKIITLIKKNKIKFCVGLNRRFSKEYVSLKKSSK